MKIAKINIKGFARLSCGRRNLNFQNVSKCKVEWDMNQSYEDRRFLMVNTRIDAMYFDQSIYIL